MSRRILQVVGGMARGGVEIWLMHLLRRIDRGHYRMDFLVRTARPQAYDDEIRALGSEVIPCLGHRRPWRFARNFAEVMAAHGPYDVVHSHLHHFNGLALRLAARHGVPLRIAHSHNDPRAQGPPRAWPWRRYEALMSRWIDRHATHKLAVSRAAAAALFGAEWARDPRTRVLYCGIDLAPFRAGGAGGALRAALGLPREALVIGHVGRFTRQKNHAFILEIAAEVMRQAPAARLLLVGDGPLRPQIEAQAAALDIADQVVFAGSRDDVPALLLDVMDVFLFPSLHEGLSLVLIEAQAAGLPCVLAADLTVEGDVVAPLIRRLPRSAPAATWAAAVLAAAGSAAVSREQALAALRASRFSIEHSAQALLALYESGPAGGAAAPAARCHD